MEGKSASISADPAVMLRILTIANSLPQVSPPAAEVQQRSTEYRFYTTIRNILRHSDKVKKQNTKFVEIETPNARLANYSWDR